MVNISQNQQAMNTFLTDNKSHHTTTKERQIDFMWHLSRQKYTDQEIANVYNLTKEQVRWALIRKAKKLTA